MKKNNKDLHMSEKSSTFVGYYVRVRTVNKNEDETNNHSNSHPMPQQHELGTRTEMHRERELRPSARYQQTSIHHPATKHRGIHEHHAMDQYDVPRDRTHRVQYADRGEKRGR